MIERAGHKLKRKMISNLPAECTRLEKLLHSVSSRTSPAATLNNARTPVSLHSSSIPPLSPDSVLNTIQHLLRQFENCEQAPVSRGWSNELRRAVETIARVTQELSHGRQTPPFPSAFRPLVHTIFWPDHWLFPLSKLHALLTRPLNGTAAATPATTPTPPTPTPAPPAVVAAASELRQDNLDITMHNLLYGMSELVSNKLYTDLMVIVVLPSLEKERWEHHQSHPYKLKRCSSGLSMWCSEMRFLRYCWEKSEVGFAREVYEKRLSDWLQWSGRDLISWYAELSSNVSRARNKQYSVDVVVLLLELSFHLNMWVEEREVIGVEEEKVMVEEKVVEESRGRRESLLVTNMTLVDLHRPALEYSMERLLVILSLICAPLPLVVNFLNELKHDKKKKNEVDEVDKHEEEVIGREDEHNIPPPLEGGPLSSFVTMFRSAAMEQTSSTPSSPSSDVLLAGGGKSSALTVDGVVDMMSWDKLLVHGVLTAEATLECAWKRHELSEAWVYPPLTEEEEKCTEQLLQALQNSSAGEGGADMSIVEPIEMKKMSSERT